MKEIFCRNQTKNVILGVCVFGVLSDSATTSSGAA